MAASAWPRRREAGGRSRACDSALPGSGRGLPRPRHPVAGAHRRPRVARLRRGAGENTGIRRRGRRHPVPRLAAIGTGDAHRYRGLRRKPALAVTSPAGKHFMPGDAELERIGIRIVVYPQDILAASVRAMRDALAGLKGGSEPPMASPAELATAIRIAEYLSQDARWPDPS